MDRLRTQVAFLVEVDRVKSVLRMTLLADASRRENDAEHSWHLALAAITLAEHCDEAERLDLLKVVRMVLIHDLVEIDAGDAYAYDAAANVGREEREARAADRIFGLLPGGQGRELRALWDEFEEGESPEARFAVALDRFQPLLLNLYSGGITWREHSVTRSQVLARMEPIARASRSMHRHAMEIVEESIRRGYLVDDR